jgi:putative phosphoesterase
MRIGLIADTHIPEARAELWPQVFDAFNGVDAILHAGDIYDLAVLDALATVAPLWACRGNGDDGSGGRPVQPAHDRLAPTWTVELAGLHVGLVHDMPIPEMPPNLTVARWIERHFPDLRPDVIVYGDSHVESVEVVDGILCVNPGSPTFPHNLSVQLGTVGFLDIDDGKAEASIWRLTDGGVEPFDWSTWRRQS